MNIQNFPLSDNKNLPVNFENEDVWMSQKQMSDLFKSTSRNMGLHIANIYKDEELLPNQTRKEIPIVQTEGTKQVSMRANPEILKHIMASKPTKAPVIISPDNRIIDGHARYLAYKATGAEDCPVIVLMTCK